jgi:hypothetical protein
MGTQNKELSDLAALSLANRHGGKRSFCSRFVCTLHDDPMLLSERVAKIARTKSSFLEVCEMTDRDNEGYLGNLTSEMMSRLPLLIESSKGHPVYVKLKDHELQKMTNLVFSPEGPESTQFLRLYSVEIFVYTIGTAYIVAMFVPTANAKIENGYRETSKWPLRNAIDLNYYLSDLRAGRKAKQAFSLTTHLGRDLKPKTTFLHRILSVCAGEFLKGGHKWEEIWRRPTECSTAVGAEKLIAYSYACLLRNNPGEDNTPRELGSDPTVLAAERLFIGQSQYRKTGLEKPKRHTGWIEGEGQEQRLHGYVGKHLMGVITNGNSSFSSTRYPNIFHGSNFFSFLIAHTLQTEQSRWLGQRLLLHSARRIYKENPYG